ncbi:polysaccharide deacetylase family protein [Bacillota bacterium Lsc_1132]
MKKQLFLFMILLFMLTSHAQAAGGIPILVYHSIDEFNGHGFRELYVTPENFEKQMMYLKNHGFTLLTFENWQDRTKVSKPILITIDDGYKNNLNVEAIFQRVKDKQFVPKVTLFVISDFVRRPNRLSASDLRRLANTGMFSIQSHTANHPNLTKTKNMEYELKSSKQSIERITGKPVIAISYPFGIFNKEIIEETKKYYRFGLTTTPEKFKESEKENENLLLPRIYVKYSTTLEEFAKIVN